MGALKARSPPRSTRRQLQPGSMESAFQHIMACVVQVRRATRCVLRLTFQHLMNPHSHHLLSLIVIGITLTGSVFADVGVGAKPISGAEVIIDGTRQTLDDKWIYWEGPGFKSAMPRPLKSSVTLPGSGMMLTGLPTAFALWSEAVG